MTAWPIFEMEQYLRNRGKDLADKGSFVGIQPVTGMFKEVPESPKPLEAITDLEAYHTGVRYGRSAHRIKAMRDPEATEIFTTAIAYASKL